MLAEQKSDGFVISIISWQETAIFFESEGAVVFLKWLQNQFFWWVAVSLANYVLQQKKTTLSLHFPFFLKVLLKLYRKSIFGLLKYFLKKKERKNSSLHNIIAEMSTGVCFQNQVFPLSDHIFSKSAVVYFFQKCGWIPKEQRFFSLLKTWS